MLTNADDDPMSWKLDVPQDCIDLYLELCDEPRSLTRDEAQEMVDLVNAWRAHEHRKHMALMEQLAQSRSDDTPS